MGEYAEMLLGGACCEGCGEVFDDIIEGSCEPGFPRLCDDCHAMRRVRKAKRKKGRPNGR